MGSLPKLSPIDVKLVLTEAYETHYGIYNHLAEAIDVTRPLGSVALHETEENSTSSRLYELISLYMEKNLKNTTGLNLMEFLSLPREYVELLLKLSVKEAKKNLSTLNEIENSINTAKK